MLLNYYKVFMKKLLGISILIGWGIFTIISNSSCESNPSSAPDTIKLSTEVFLAPGVSDTDGLRLTCGCEFKLNLMQSGGDTSAFRVTDLDTMSTMKTPHHILMQVTPGFKSGQYNAWYAFWAVDHLGGTDYDTLQLSADF
jgi:hypothetical protein